MSFGWVIAARDETVLVQGAGPRHGRGSLLRAKASGILAATVFISQICSFTQKSSLNTRNFSDNQELIRQLYLGSEYTIPFPNETTKG